MIIWGTRRIQKIQFDSYVSSSIRQLRGMGINAGDRVVLSAPTSVEYVVVLLALWRMKAVACPVNPLWPQKMTEAYAARISARHVFKSADIPRAVCFDARLPAGQAGLPLPPASGSEFDLDQEVTVIATSGTSGGPKAAVHTWGDHFYSAKGSQAMVPLTAQDRWLLALPLYHVSGIAIVARCFLAGAFMIIPDACLPAGRPALPAGGGKDLVSAIERGKATHVSLVAAQLTRLLDGPGNHAVLRSLKYILLGGSVIPAALVERCLLLGLPVYLSYGLTEMSSQVATGKPVNAKTPCLKVLPHRQLSIASDGEILVKGETLFKGYVAGPRLHLPLTSDGWFKTGDLGALDTEGCLTVLGRRDNMFISGGENIQPEEIEKALLAIEGVEQAIVVPKEHKEFGHRPVAFVKFHGQALDAGQLATILGKDLPRFKIPDVFYPWPKTMEQGIKISRQDLMAGLGRF